MKENYFDNYKENIFIIFRNYSNIKHYLVLTYSPIPIHYAHLKKKNNI